MSICIIPNFLLLWKMLQRLFMVQVSWCAGVHTEKLLSLGTSDSIIQLCLSRTYCTRLSSQAQWPKVNQPFHCQDLPGPTGPKALPGSLPMPLSPRFSWHAGPHCLCLVEGVSLSSWSETSSHSPQTVVMSVSALAWFLAPRLSYQLPWEGRFSNYIIRAKESLVTVPRTDDLPTLSNEATEPFL